MSSSLSKYIVNNINDHKIRETDFDQTSSLYRPKEEELFFNASAQHFRHTDSVFCCASSPVDSKIFVSGGGDDKAILWHVVDNGSIHTKTQSRFFMLEKHTDSVAAVAFNYSGEYIATAGLDGLCCIWSSKDGKLIHALEGPEDGLEWVSWHSRGNVVIAGGPDATCWMWNAAKGRCINVYAGHSAALTCGRFSSNGKRIITGSLDSSLRIWEPRSGRSELVSGHGFQKDAVTCLAVHPSKPIVVCGGDQGGLTICNIQAAKALATLQFKESIESIAICGMSNTAIAGTVKGKLIIVDINQARVRGTWDKPHRGVITKIVPINSAQSPLVLTCSTDGTLNVWDSRSGNANAVQKQFQGHHDAILDMSVTHDGKKVMTVSDDQTVLVFDLQ
mmetsp:Transcript_4172/g.6295  ORF Transcript_4172/g.6295 Transcript_4172/m.6295 type:complete len:390 (+) Transcript_4172:2-1171(+)